MKRMCVMLVAALAAAAWAAPSSAQSFGNAMVVSGDQIIVGEPVYEMRSGVVYVFDRDGNGDWAQSQMLEPSDASAANRFGISLGAGRSPPCVRHTCGRWHGRGLPVRE